MLSLEGFLQQTGTGLGAAGQPLHPHFPWQCPSLETACLLLTSVPAEVVFPSCGCLREHDSLVLGAGGREGAKTAGTPSPCGGQKPESRCWQDLAPLKPSEEDLSCLFQLLEAWPFLGLWPCFSQSCHWVVPYHCILLSLLTRTPTLLD